MAVAFRSSSTTGVGDSFVTTLNVPVPSGAATNDFALLAIEQWESANPTVTWPSGFTQVINQVSGSQKLKIAWKRLTGADSGNYSVTWTGSQWSQGQCILLTGGKLTGDPIGANTVTGTATSTSVPSLSTGSLAFEPFLGHFVANENSATGTPPTNFTETQEANYLKSNYRVPASTGVQTASGGTLSTSTLLLAALIAVEPEPTGGPATITGAAAFTGEGVLGSAGVVTKLGATAASGEGVLGSAAVVGKLAASSLTSEGVLVAAGVITRLAGSGLSADGSLGSTAVVTRLGAAGLSGEGVLGATAGGASVVSGACEMSAQSELFATIRVVTFGAAVFTAEGALSGNATVAGQRWRLKPPQHVTEYVIVGSLKTRMVVEETVFGDENGLFTSYDQNIPVGADEYQAIPFGTKYIWHGGSDNTTDDPAIKNLWLANGFDIEPVV